MKILKGFIHIFLIVFLTLLTQIGGIIWILVFLYFKYKKTNKSRRYKLATFTVCYLLISLVLVPQLSKLNGRIALPVIGNENLAAHNFMTILLNRHYVTPDLRDILLVAGSQFTEYNPGLKIKYLDANFPFITCFPLLPHLSHDDGKKVDLSFQYIKDGKPSNQKPSISGYGHFVNPKGNDTDQVKICKSKGYWQYDYPKFLSFGTRDGYTLDAKRTKQIIQLLLKSPKSQKLFVEPHLKNRIGIKNEKIRYQGCHSVRHDDHIHFQIK